MSVSKRIHLTSTSGESIEAAMEKALAKASKSLRGIHTLTVNEVSATVENNRIKEYHVRLDVEFDLEGEG